MTQADELLPEKDMRSVIYREGTITIADYDEAIQALQDAKSQMKPDGRNCAICSDSGHQAMKCHHNPLLKVRELIAKHECSWRCFHCNAEFTDSDSAQAHFGNTESETAACLHTPHPDTAAVKDEIDWTLKPLTAEQHEKLMAILDAPAKDLPKLRKLLSEPSVFETAVVKQLLAKGAQEMADLCKAEMVRLETELLATQAAVKAAVEALGKVITEFYLLRKEHGYIHIVTEEIEKGREALEALRELSRQKAAPATESKEGE